MSAVLIACVFIAGLGIGAIASALYLYWGIVTGLREVRGMVRQDQLWATCPACGVVEPCGIHNRRAWRAIQ